MSRGVLEPSYRKRIGYQAMLLGGMATLCSTALVLGDHRTHAAIAERFAEDLQANLSQVIPAELHDNNLLDDTLQLPAASNGQAHTVYRALENGEVSAVAFEVVGQGYAGDITCLMAVGRDGQLLGVRVVAHAETPGLGDKIELAKNDWILSFNGHSLENTTAAQWHVKKDGGVFDQFSGATITPRAVVEAVHDGLQFFDSHRSTLLAYTPPAPETAPESPMPTDDEPEEAAHE